MKKNLDSIPFFGAGIGLRTELERQLREHAEDVLVLEVITERFFEKSAREGTLASFAKDFRIIPHGVKLSIGSALPLDYEHLEKVKAVCEFLDAPYYSEHFALTRHGDEFDTGHLSPIWFTQENLEVVIAHVKEIQDYLERPLVLENITSSFEIPNADYEEPEFISAVCQETGCGLLLDLTNVFINAYNRKTDPYDFLQRIPLDRVIHMHLAGGKLHHGVMEDTHSEPLSGINEEVWPLLEWTAPRATRLSTLIIERDSNFSGSFEDMLLTDLRRAQKIIEDSKKG